MKEAKSPQMWMLYILSAAFLISFTYWICQADQHSLIAAVISFIGVILICVFDWQKAIKDYMKIEVLDRARDEGLISEEKWREKKKALISKMYDIDIS